MSGMIACCLCGIPMSPNEVAMCLQCLKEQVDITSNIEKNCEILQCTKCKKWHFRHDQWVSYEMESSGLMALCLKKVGGLNKARIIDAVWVWTEPHSKRIKIAADIEQAVLDNRLNVQQKVVIEFVIKNKQCIECIREATEHNWGALIQLRHRVGHKRSLYLLEDLLVKSGLHNLMSGIEITKDGMDLYFKAKNQSEKVIDFLTSKIPMKIKSSKKLVSSDNHSNTQKYEYTIILEIVPLCKGDLILLPKENKQNISSLLIISKLSTNIHCLNPCTLQKIELSASKYFAKPFLPILTARHLTSFVVLDIEIININQRSNIHSSIMKEDGGVLAEVEVSI